jgi:hypothetical protein
MRLPPVRITVGRLMILVAVVALPIWIVAERTVLAPERARQRRYMAHHEIRAGIWRGLAIVEYPRGTPQYEECTRLAAWHERRFWEIDNRGLPSSASWWEEGRRITRYEQEVFGRYGVTGIAPVQYDRL